MKKIFLIFSLCISACTFSKSHSPSVAKKGFLSNKSSLHKMGKSRGYFQIEVTDSYREEEIITLQAQVTSREDMENVSVEWKVPNGVTIISNTSPTEQAFLAANPYLFSITLDQKTLKENDSIFFFAYKIINNERHGGSFTYTYREKNLDDSSEIKSLKVEKKPKVLE